MPQYDTYPLIIVIGHYPNGFLGLNLHYLDVTTRMNLMRGMMDYTNTENISKRTKLLVNYDILQSNSAISSLMEPCIKRYLFNHVRSQFIEIFATEYFQALQAPLQQFHYNN